MLSLQVLASLLAFSQGLGPAVAFSSKAIPTGKHTLRIRARDGDGRLERLFTMSGSRQCAFKRAPR